MRKQYFNLGVCIACGSGRLKVTSSRKPFRYVRCEVCKKSWKTLEIVLSKNWLPEALADLLADGLLVGYEHILSEICCVCNCSVTHIERRALAKHIAERDNMDKWEQLSQRSEYGK